MLKTYTTDKGSRTTNILIDHIHIPSVAYFLARPLKLVQTSLKVKRSGGYTVSGGIFLCKQRVFPPKTFSLSRLYNGRRRQRKQATDGKVRKKDKTAYRLVQIGPNSICCYFIIWKGYFLETQIKWAGGQLRSLQKNQNPCVFFVERFACQFLLYLYASLYPFISVFSMSEAR